MQWKNIYLTLLVVVMICMVKSSNSQSFYRKMVRRFVPERPAALPQRTGLPGLGIPSPNAPTKGRPPIDHRRHATRTSPALGTLRNPLHLLRQPEPPVHRPFADRTGRSCTDRLRRLLPDRVDRQQYIEAV